MSVQTHIVECNRANSVIDSSTNNLGRWTTGCNLELLPGDRVNVEACVVNSTGASSGGSTMEFTGQNVVVQGEEKKYSDNHVVFEFGFYINNNQSSSIQLPIRQNMRYWAGDPELGPTILNSTRTGDGTSGTPYAYIQQPDVGWGTGVDFTTPGTISTAGGVSGTLPVPLAVNRASLDNCVGFFPGRGIGFGFGATQQFSYVRVFNRAASTVDSTIVAGTKYNFIAVGSWSNVKYPGIADASTYLGCNCGPDITTYDFPPPVLQNPIPNGTCVQYWNFPLRPGMDLWLGSTSIGSGGSIGTIKKLWIGTNPDLAVAMAFPTLVGSDYNTRIVIELEEDFETTAAHAIYSPLRGRVAIGNDPTYGDYDNRGRMGYGLINPSSQPQCYHEQTIEGYWHTEGVTTYPAATGATIDYCRQRALAGMMLWERGRHYFSEWDYRNEGGPTAPFTTPEGGIQYLETLPAPGTKENKYNKMTPQWRSFGCSQPVMLNKLGSNTFDPDYAYGGMKNSALGPSQWMSTNLRDNKDNAPYILVAPTYQGPQVLPDGSALAPEIRKLTCFVSVKITDSFTSALDVAKQFTDAFHQANPFLKRSQIVQKNNERPAKVNTIKPVYKATPFINPNKSQRVAEKSTTATTPGTGLDTGVTRDGIPLVPTNAYIENASGPCNLAMNRRALYDVVAPVYSGNLVKCIPCNLMPGINWDKQPTAPYNYVPNDEDDYHFSGVAGKAWCNLIYGGMAVKDFQKWSSGDLLCRLKCWNGDVTGKLRQFPRAVILNTKLRNITVSIPNPVYLPTIPYSTEEGKVTDWGGLLAVDPALASGTEWTGYPTYTKAAATTTEFIVPPFSNTGWDFTAPCDYFQQTESIPFTGTQLNKYQYLFTSIEYTEDNLDLLQRALRNNEKYGSTAHQGEISVAAQNSHPGNWYYEYDIGMANDEVGMNLRPEVSRTEPGDPLYSYYDYPMLGNFDDDHSAECMLNGMARYYVNGSKCDSATPATYEYYKLRKGDQWVEGVLTGHWCSPPLLPTSVTVPPYGSRVFANSVISPAQSYKGQGWETKYQSARGCGIVQCFSRWCDFDVPTPYNKWYELEGYGPGNCDVFSAASRQYLVDPTPSIKRNIGVIPYIYTDEDSVEHKFCAFQAFRTYDPRSGTANALSTTIPTSTKNWELATIQWGDLFGFSPSLLDNPAILPMNNDIPATQGKDAYVQGIDSWTPTTPATSGLPNYKDVGTKMTSQEEPFNKVNFTWIGSINAGVNFNSQTDRFEITGFNSPNVLSSLDQPAPPPTTSGGGGAARQGYENLAGVGSNIATYGNDVDTSYFGTDLEMYNKSEKLYAQDIDVFEGTGATILSSGGQYNIRNDRYNDDTNQGKADSQTGVFIENIFLAPENWEPPTLPYGGDLQNYWVPGTDNLNATEEQRELIIKDLVKADEENFDGSLLHKMGFTLEQLVPTYGSQDGDFNPVTNGSTNPSNMYSGTKPLILNTLSDVASNQITNLFSNPFDANAYVPATTTAPITPAVTGYPFSNLDSSNYVGLPQFHQGSVNNLAVNVSNSIPGTLVAQNLPSLYASAYYLVISDIVPTEFQSDQNGNVGNSNAIFYAMKNYGAGDFYYSSGSDYWQVVTKRRLVTSITTEIRSPTTGKLATLGPNSVVLYKIQRTFNLPNPQQILMEASELEQEQMKEYEKEVKRQKNNMKQ